MLGIPGLARRVLLVQYGHRPNELVVKKLAMLGCVAMVLAHSVRERPEQLRINAYAGVPPSPTTCQSATHSVCQASLCMFKLS